MKEKISLQHLAIPKKFEKEIPLFYHFIHYNKLEQLNPFDYAEYSDLTQSIVQFQKSQKPVSKIVDYALIKTSSENE